VTPSPLLYMSPKFPCALACPCQQPVDTGGQLSL